MHEALAEEVRPLHRIAFFQDFDANDGRLEASRVAVAGALLRHELEHARQYDAVGSDTFDIDDQFLDHAIRQRVGGLPSGTDLYNFKPMELDANAAAAMYLRDHHPEHLDAILKGPHASLARSLTPPETPETLLERTVACLFLFRDICDRNAAKSGIEFWKHLKVYDSRAAELWRALDGHNQ